MSRRRRRETLSVLTLILLGKGRLRSFRHVPCAASWRGSADPEARK